MKPRHGASMSDGRYAHNCCSHAASLLQHVPTSGNLQLREFVCMACNLSALIAHARLLTPTETYMHPFYQ